MDQLAEMRVFVRAIECGSFAGAAGSLKLTPSAVSKLVRRLEERLGVRLINRTTRKLSLTAEGEAYFHSGRRLVDAVDGLEQEVSASAGSPRGMLRISASLPFGLLQVAPALINFRQRYPDVRVHVSLNDRNVDLLAEQIDVALRLGPLKDSNLMARKLTEIERVICASPEYIKRFGAPKTYDDLARHQCVVFAIPGRDRWPFRTADGGLIQLQVSGIFTADNSLLALDLVLRGAGIARVPDFIAAEAIHSGKLVPLLADQHHSERTPIFAVFPAGSQKIPKVRVFLDFLVKHFEQEQWPHEKYASKRKSKPS
jgi:DNA-binding transcriptional LysR family regulator